MLKIARGNESFCGLCLKEVFSNQPMIQSDSEEFPLVHLTCHLRAMQKREMTPFGYRGGGKWEGFGKPSKSF